MKLPVFRQTKRNLSCLVLLFVLITTSLSANTFAQLEEISFPDVPSSHLHSEAIEYLANRNIVAGYDNGNFGPNNELNRAELVKILVNAKYKKEDEANHCLKNYLEKLEKKEGLKLSFGNSASSSVSNSSPDSLFPDVDPLKDWFAKYICVAKRDHLISGYPDGTFQPGNPVNFAEASKIIVNASIEVMNPGDSNKGEKWYKPFVDRLSERKAIPYSLQAFDQKIKRGEVMEIYYRLLSENKNKLSHSYYEIAGLDHPDLNCDHKTRFEVSKAPDFIDVVGEIQALNVDITLANTGSMNLESNGDCALRFYDEKENLIPTSFTPTTFTQPLKVSIQVTRDQSCDEHAIKIKADQVSGLTEIRIGSGNESDCSKEYWYTVIKGWHTVNDGLFGGVFKERKYTKENENLIENLFAETTADGKHKEMIVKVTGKARGYDESDLKAEENKKKMIKNYRTTRWHEIRYGNNLEKRGWVPVSAVVLKDEEVYEVTQPCGNDRCYRFTSNKAYCGYSNIPGGSRGYDPMDDPSLPLTPLDKLLLHNTAGYRADINVCAHYTLGAGSDNFDEKREFKNKLVAIIPEYRGSGSLGTKNSFKPSIVERRSISVEMANIEWVNLSKKAGELQVIDQNFQNIKDTEGLKEFSEIKGKNYDLINEYFDEKEGGFNLDLEQVKRDRDVFDEFYHTPEGKNIYQLKDSYMLIAEKSNPTDSEKNSLKNIYPILNKIPLNYNFYIYTGKGTGIFKGNIKDIVYAKDTIPHRVYSDSSISEQKINLSNALKKKLGKNAPNSLISSYYQKYTDKQYENMNRFIGYTNKKYNIALKTFEYPLPGNTESHYAFYFAQGAKKWGVYDENDSYGKLLNTLINFNGVISHRNQTFTGKMCPAPGFKIDRIPVLNP